MPVSLPATGLPDGYFFGVSPIRLHRFGLGEPPQIIDCGLERDDNYYSKGQASRQSANHYGIHASVQAVR
jgi:hypothetical protein